MIVTKLARYLSTGIVALFVAACGGGGGGSGDGGVASAGSGSSSATTPSTPSTPATGNTPRPTSGIEGTGRHVASIGTITAFGSIFVNGIEYSTDRASIEVDGRAVAQSDLRLGQVVTVVGTLNTDGKTAVADQVSFSAPLVGAIDSIDARNAQLVILGQRVQVDGATKFAADVGGDSIAALSVGMELQVSGFRDSRGVLSARSIERRRAGQAYVATGDAVTVDAAAQRLAIGTLQVSYRSATLAGFNGRAPAAGDHVRAEALVPAAGGVLEATRLALVDRRLPAQTGNTGHLQGWVTRFVSATDFDVEGIAITTDASTKYNAAELAGFGGLRLDRFVNVVGVLLADGRLLATDIVTNNLVMINMPITRSTPTSIEYTNGVGSSCATAGTSYTVDGRAADWSAVKPGEVAILYMAFGGDIATRCPIVTVNHAVRGPVESVDARRGRLRVLGQTVTALGTARVLDLEQSRSIDALAQLQPGTVVEVSGYRNAAGTLVATRIGSAAAQAPLQVSGEVASLDTGARRFAVGALTVDYSSATPSGFPSGAPAAGQRVIVRGTQAAAGVLRASELEYDSPNLRGTAVGAAHVIGPVTKYTSEDYFEIEGRPVRKAPDWQRFQFSCDQQWLQQDAFVGAITAAQPIAGLDGFFRVGVFHTTLGESTTSVHGRVDSVDAASRTLVVGGLEVALHGLTRLRLLDGQNGGCGSALDPGAIRVGDTVAISGAAGPSRQAFIAADVQDQMRAVTGNIVTVGGTPAAFADTGFALDGIDVRFAPATTFPNCGVGADAYGELTVAEFLLLARRQLARGEPPSVTVTAPLSASVLDVMRPSSVSACLPSGERTGQLRGPLESVDAANGRIVVLGIPVSLGSVKLTASVGQFIGVSVRWRPLRGTLEAEAIEVPAAGASTTTIVEAAPDSLANPDAIVLGRSIRTDVNTVFVVDGAASTASAFFGGTWGLTRFEVERISGGGLRAVRVEASSLEQYF